MYTLWQPMVQLILVTMWIQAKGETCDVHGYTRRFKSRFNGRMFVVRFTLIFPGRNAMTQFVFFSDLELLAFYSSILQIKNHRQANCFFFFFIFFLSHNILS